MIIMDIGFHEQIKIEGKLLDWNQMSCLGNQILIIQILFWESNFSMSQSHSSRRIQIPFKLSHLTTLCFPKS